MSVLQSGFPVKENNSNPGFPVHCMTTRNRYLTLLSPSEQSYKFSLALAPVDLKIEHSKLSRVWHP